jgi:hypothetical protein
MDYGRNRSAGLDRRHRTDSPVMDLAEAGIRPEEMHQQDLNGWETLRDPNRPEVRTQKQRIEDVLTEPFDPPEEFSDSRTAVSDSKS